MRSFVAIAIGMLLLLTPTSLASQTVAERVVDTVEGATQPDPECPGGIVNRVTCFLGPWEERVDEALHAPNCEGVVTFAHCVKKDAETGAKEMRNAACRMVTGKDCPA